MKLMRKLPDGTSVEVKPMDMTKDELERLGKYLAKLAEEGKHPKGHDPETCQKFAGIACGVVGRELHQARAIWREQEAAHWGNPPAVIECEAGCGEKFKSNLGMRAHIQKHHPEAGSKLPAYYPKQRIPIPAQAPQPASTPPRTYAPRKRAAKSAPRTAKTVMFANVAEGFYALPSGNHIEFYKVDVPTKGRWTNYRFIRKFEDGDGKFHRVANRDEATSLLDLIAKDPAEAGMRFKTMAPTAVKTAEMAW